MLKKLAKLDFSIPVNVRFLVWVVIGLMMLFGVALILQGQLDTQNYHQQIRQIVKERTGRDVYIRGGVNVVLLPTPTIYVSGVELRDINDGKPVPAFLAELILIKPVISSFFEDKLEIESIAMENPTLEVDRASDGIIHWDWLEKELFQLLETTKGAAPQELDVIGGTIIYRNTVTGRKFRVYNININGNTGASPNFSGGLSFNDQAFSFSVLSKGQSSASGDIPLLVRVAANDQNYVQLDGNANISHSSLKVNGDLQVDIKDMYPWITLQKDKSKPVLEQFMQGSRGRQDTQAVLPVKFSGKWKQNGDDILLNNVVWEGLNSKGKGQMTASLADGFSIDSRLHFESLDYERWRMLIETISEQLALDETGRYVIDESLRESVLPEDLKVNFEMTSDKLFIRSQVWENVKVSVEMADAALTINQLFLELPGDSTLAMFGVVSQSATTRGMRFEGSIETEGKSLKQVLSIFDASVAELPNIGFEEFFIRSNIYVSNDQVRLSEADVRFDELQLGGGLVIYYDAENPRVEADVRLEDTNFDYFRDVWREQYQESKPEDFFLRFNKNINLDWLKRLETTIDLKINVDRFTFLERDGTSAYVRLFAQQGQLGLYNIRFYYPDDTLEMNLTLNVQREKPYVNLVLNANELDTAYFNPFAPEKETLETEEEEALPEADTDAETDTIVNISTQSQQRETNGTFMLAQSNTRTIAPSDFSPDDATTQMDLEKNRSATTKDWSKELIDMSWMEGFDGAFDISLRKLIHDDLEFEAIKMRASLSNRSLTVQQVGFNYWGGNCELTGNLYGGKVPGLTLGFTLYNVELNDMLSSLMGYDNISGKASVSGTFSTSGVNYLSWLSQSEAKMTVSGRGVSVKGFNLAGVVNTVRVSRTAADVLNNVNRALVSGSTRMTADGVINVKNGVMRSPGITLRTGNIIGGLTGDVSLVPWTMDMAMNFQFPEISSETIPTLLVQLNGSIDDPALTTDTSSLEAYVVKGIKQK